MISDRNHRAVGGELGIRTLEAFRPTAFRVLHLRPLGQLSMYSNVKRNGQNFKQFLLQKAIGKKNRQERNNQPNPSAPQTLENQRFFPDVPIKAFRAFESGPL